MIYSYFHSEGLSFLIWVLRCSIRTNIAVTRYNSQYRRSAPSTRTALRWLLNRNLALRSCSATLQFGPLHSGKCSYFQYISRSKKRANGTTASNGCRLVLATVIRPLRRPCVPGRVRSRRMIASAAVTAPRAAHSNAIATAPEDFTPQISSHKFQNHSSKIDQNFLHKQLYKIASKSDPKSTENRFSSPLSLYCSVLLLEEEEEDDNSTMLVETSESATYWGCSDKCERGNGMGGVNKCERGKSAAGAPALPLEANVEFVR